MIEHGISTKERLAMEFRMTQSGASIIIAASTRKSYATATQRMLLESVGIEHRKGRTFDDAKTLIEQIVAEGILPPSSVDPPTQKQLDYMNDLGIAIPQTITKQKASQLIDEKLKDLNAQAQVPPAWNAVARTTRTMNELVGICRGIIFDGVVVPSELEGLKGWVSANKEVASVWPACELVDFLDQIYADGMATPEECNSAKAFIERIVGPKPTVSETRNRAAALPLDNPAPQVVFESKVFVFTGELAYAPRDVCCSEVKLRNGVAENAITKRTDYLVIGTLGSADWANSSFGRKIEKAIEYRAKETGIQIIEENHWVAALDTNPM